LKNRIVDTMKIASDNSQTASAKNKRYSDIKSSKRSFKVGDEVLVFLPSTTNKLLMEWKGAYKVQVCKHPDYQVLMGTKTKLLHANMLKQYHKRPTHLVDDNPKVSFQDTSGTQTAAHTISTPWSEITTAEPWMFNRKRAEKTCTRVNAAQACLGFVDDSSDDGVTLPTLPEDSKSKESIKDIKFDSDLTKSQYQQLYNVFRDFPKRLSTSVALLNADLYHDIPLTTTEPSRKNAYKLPFKSQKIIETEVVDVLSTGIIEYAFSSYSKQECRKVKVVNLYV